MKDRAAEIASFLVQNGWGEARHTPLRADFSPRRFARLENKGGKIAILMDADADQHTSAFVAIAGLLRQIDIAAPQIYASDTVQGLVLMQDFGDRCVGKMLDAGDDVSGGAGPLYRRATDILVHLHKHFDKGMATGISLPAYGGALFATQAELFLDAYIPFAQNREATRDECEEFRAAWKQVLRGIEVLPQSLLLRDFMPDNLMDLSGTEKAAHRSMGVLDFQDAGLGPAPYDLASLCEVVRRNGGEGMLDEMVEYYCDQTTLLPKVEMLRACRVLAAQRHTRILGIVANWIVKNGGNDKIAYIERIWVYLDHLLRDEALKPVRIWMERYMAPRRRDVGT